MKTDLNTSHGGVPGFVLFPLIGLTLVLKLRNFDFESQLNTLIFLIKKCVTSNWNISHEENVRSCFISIFWVHLSHKTEKS